MLVAVVTVKAVVYEPLPNRPEARGFYYCLDMADYPNLLQSNMPYEVMVGYIVADSAIRAMPSITRFYNPIEELNLFSDTAEYIYKYWYLMNEYDPVRFYSFLGKKYPVAKNKPRELYSDISNRMHRNPKFKYVVSDYILHIYVNNTVHIDTANTKIHYHDWSKTIAYCKVLDTLKGGVFPSLENAIFYNGENSIIGKIIPQEQETDIVFSYIDQWQRWPDKPLFDSNSEYWIKPEREYIVFLQFFGIDAIGSWDPIGSIHKQYYSLIPYPLRGSRSMYPIENGNVIDEKNALGFGTVIPVDVFKQNIRDKINEIKNYGE